MEWCRLVAHRRPHFVGAIGAQRFDSNFQPANFEPDNFCQGRSVDEDHNCELERDILSVQHRSQGTEPNRVLVVYSRAVLLHLHGVQPLVVLCAVQDTGASPTTKLCTALEF